MSPNRILHREPESFLNCDKARAVSQTGSCSILSTRLPAQAEGIGRPVVLALRDEPRAAVVEAEHLVGEVQALPKHRETLLYTEAGLGINLQMGVKIVVSDRAFGPEVAGIFAGRVCRLRWGALLPLILVNARAVVGGAETGRKAAPIVAGTKIPHGWSLTLQGWVVRTERECARARTSLAEVCRDAEAAPNARQEPEVLDVGELDTVELRVHAVFDVVEYVAFIRWILRSLVVRIGKVIDRLAQSFVEEAGLKLTIRFQVVLVEHIVVVGMFRLEVRIADGNGRRGRGGILRYIGHHVIGIRTRNSASVNGANV